MILKSKKTALFLVLAILAIVLASCSKAECKSQSDCASKKCSTARCSDSKCVYTQRANCCGNLVREANEDGKPGDKCTCPEDYGKCEGSADIKVGSKTMGAAYARYYCDADEKCVFGVDEKAVSQQSILNAINVGFFKASAVLRYNKPFVIGKDAIEIRITVDDASKDLSFPIQLNKVKILYTGSSSRIEQLVAEHELADSFGSIGEEIVVRAPLNMGYKPQEIEESGSFRFAIDYVYSKRVAQGKVDGQTQYVEEQVRATYTSSPSPVYLVRADAPQ